MIYLDNHATTPVDPRVIEMMAQLMRDSYANPGSITHAAGREIADRVAASIYSLATNLGANMDELVLTSGATESNNLALMGFCLHPRQHRRKIVSVVSEHKAILDPLLRLQSLGFDVELLPVGNSQSRCPGQVDLQSLESAVDANTALVTIMLANNEIGIIQPLAKIADLCRQHGVMLHTDATQAVGQMHVDVNELDVDMMSFSAHKFNGPKGVGGLYVRSRPRRIRLLPQIVGGGQQDNRRSGTLNSIGIIAMDWALRYSLQDMANSALSFAANTGRIGNQRIRLLRDALYARLANELKFVQLNGPLLESTGERLFGNLNCSFYPLEGQSLMLACPDLAVSSGSACTSANPSPSHVLLSMGLSEDQARSSLRFGVGRFNTQSEIDQAADWIIAAAQKLKRLI